MICEPIFVFGGTEGIGSRFHFLRSRACFRWYRGRQIVLSCFPRPDSSSEVPRAFVPVFMSSAPGLIFGNTEGVGSRFHVLRARTNFLRYRGRRVPFSYFALPDSFSAVPSASGPVFLFCASGLIFSGSEGVRSRFHVLHPDTISAVPRASGLVFLFCTSGLIFGGTEGVGSRFHVLFSRTHFRRYRGRQVLFSCFALPDTFSAVRRASGLDFMIGATGLIFDGTKDVGSRFHVLRARTHFIRYRGRLDLFHVLRSRTCFQPCRVRRVLFSCFVRPDSYSAVPRAMGLVLMFCAPGFVFGGTEGFGSRFHVLRARTHFRRYRGRQVPF
jgi:hypothetical protein